MIINFKVADDGQFIDKLLSLLSFLHSPLTDTEALILKTFLCLPPKFRYHRFSSIARKAVIRILSEQGLRLTSANLNNRLYSLIDKKYLRRDEDKVIYTADFLEKILLIYNKNRSFNISLNFIESRQNTTADSESLANTQS